MQAVKSSLDVVEEVEYPILRAKRTSRFQYELMLSFLEKHPQLASGKVTETFTREHRHRLWDELSNILNKFPGGPIKSNQQWRKTWNDLKCSARAKAFGSKRQNAENGPTPNYMSPIEKKAVAISKWNESFDERLSITHVDSASDLIVPEMITGDINVKDGISTSSDSDVQSEPKLQDDITRTLLHWSSIDNVELEDNLLTNDVNGNVTELQNTHVINDDVSLQNSDTNDIKPCIDDLAETAESNDLADEIEAIFSAASKSNPSKRKEHDDTARRTAAVEGIAFLEKEKSKSLSRIAEAKEKLLFVEQKKLEIAQEHLEIKRKKLELSRDHYYLHERTTVAEENKAKAFSIIAELLRAKYSL